MHRRNGVLEPAWHLDVIEEVGSTSEVLKQRAEVGGGEVAVLARRQLAGHGRMGRPWASLEGNLHLSVLVRMPALRWPGHWSILAGVALAQAVQGVTPGQEIRARLKWPNDLLLAGRKAAGILVEAGGVAGAMWVVIGFGVNLRRAPEGLDRSVACLGEFCTAPEPESFALSVLDALGSWRLCYDQEGFEPVRTAWLALGPAFGDRLVVGGRPGLFRGLAVDGGLMLEDEAGVRVIRTGEVE